METKRAIASVATAFALVLAGCSSEDVDPEALPEVEETAEEARADAEEALADLQSEAQEAVDELQTTEAPEIKQELLDRCQEALDSMREAGSETTEAVQDVCERIEAADLSDIDLWNEIQQEIDNLQMS